MPPIHDFICENGHKTEDVLTPNEEEAMIEEYGELFITCPICENRAGKIKGIELTSNMSKSWAEQTWKEKKEGK